MLRIMNLLETVFVQSTANMTDNTVLLCFCIIPNMGAIITFLCFPTEYRTSGTDLG